MENPEVEEQITDLEGILGHFINVTTKSLNRLSREMSGFKEEMKEFKDEMKDFKIEAITDRRNLTKQMGEISNKMGTLVEDSIAPAVRPVILKYFHEEVIDFSVNRIKYVKAQNLRAEFDVIAVTEKCVYLVEVKSAPRIEHFELFKSTIQKFRQLFPEFKNLQLIPILASMRFDNEMIPKISEAGFYAMAYRDWDYMDILNFNDLNKK